MNRATIGSIFFIITFVLFENVHGWANFKWVSLNAGDPLPENITLISNEYTSTSTSTYVGRARHFDEILPAVVYENGTVFISSCSKNIPKYQYEILTTTEDCYWQNFRGFDDIDDSILHVGTAWNNEPIYFVRYREQYYSDYSVSSFYLHKESSWNPYNYQLSSYLSCKSQTKWVDTSSRKLPENAVSGGKSDNDFEMYVARLKKDCEIVTGQVIADAGIATAVLNDDTAIEASFCQVLTGEPNEYSWEPASDGEIPDYAVVNGKHNNERSYIARINNTIGHLTYSKVFDQRLDYEILVENHF